MRTQGRSKNAIYALSMICVCMVVAGSAGSSEFRPYDLPLKYRQRSVEQEPQANLEAGKVVDEKAYADFQRKVAGMSSEQKTELRVYFTKKRGMAQGLQEYKYYSRLIDILDKK